MLTGVLRALVYELFLEKIYEKMIKQLIILIVFYTSRESGINTFLISLINNCS